uniref:Ropporin-1-like protein n=1 Tax=Timema monikensis TaxID=170555 RepID=A0A7R9E634_9NEOP|nr:unnamed protein product [Timema monikensis]
MVGQILSSPHISIPPTLPSILKEYCKAAIRTQPHDLLGWSTIYFQALADGEDPPVKERLEYPPIPSPSGLTQGHIKALLKSLNSQEKVSQKALKEKWEGLYLDENALQEMLQLGGFEEEIDLLKFVSVASGHLTKSLYDTMVLLCELLTEDPKGGLAKLPLEIFSQLYTFLAAIDGEHKSQHQQNIQGIGPRVPVEQVDAVIGFMRRCAQLQEGMVMPANLHDMHCPHLDVTTTFNA